MKDFSNPSRVNPYLPSYILGQQITALASTGFSKVGIARHFRVNVQTLNRWMEEDETLQEAFVQGREEEWNARLFLYQLRSDKTGTRGAVYGAREEAYGGADRESAAAG
jgi:hypothetical protein